MFCFLYVARLHGYLREYLQVFNRARAMMSSQRKIFPHFLILHMRNVLCFQNRMQRVGRFSIVVTCVWTILIYAAAVEYYMTWLLAHNLNLLGKCVAKCELMLSRAINCRIVIEVMAFCKYIHWNFINVLANAQWTNVFLLYLYYFVLMHFIINFF